MTRTAVYDGTKAVPISRLPEEAWQIVTGTDKDDVADRYTTVGWLYRCVEVHATYLLTVPWAIYRGDNPEPVWTHETDNAPTELDWLEPLPDLLLLTDTAWTLTGTAYWSVDRNRLNTRRALGWYAPSTMTPQWSETEGLVGFTRRIQQQRIPLDRDDVVYFCQPNALHETQPGEAPAAVALRDADVLYNVDEFARMFFERGAIKATILGVPQGTLPAEKERLRAWYQRVMKGIKNAFAAEVVNADAVKPTVIGEGLAELANTTLTQEKREGIATTLGIPHSLVLSNAANRSVAEQDEKNIYQQTVLPRARLIQRQLNTQLLRPLGYALQFQPQSLSIFQEDEEARAQSLAHYVGAGMPLPVAAEILGITLPEGMEYADLVVATAPAIDVEREQEIRRFRRWAGKRRDPDPATFETPLLSMADKIAILEGDGVAGSAPFRWASYP